MEESKIAELLCCPVCKGRLECPGAGEFACAACGLSFPKRGSYYDFKVRQEVATPEWKNRLGDRFSSDGPWFREVQRHYSATDFVGFLCDPMLAQMEAYTSNLTAGGVDLGERYDRELLAVDSIRDVHELQIALRHIPSTQRNEVALDLGAGTLRGTKELLKRGFRTVLAVDLLPEMMRHGLPKLGPDANRVVLIRADVRFLPVADRTVDLTLSMGLISHVNPAFLLLLELKRATWPGGAVVINTWNADGLGYRSYLKQNGRSRSANGFYYRYYGPREIKDLADRLGVDSTVRPYGFYPGRRLAHMLGRGVLKPAIALDGMFSRILPRSLFPFLVLSFRLAHELAATQAEAAGSLDGS